ncbi:hypothetical protein C9374_002414 [Naegleria lovaniensis]|uniref:Uncharacterized protein n=1 Tax=Naegleria lovaniensis TaxID=51637 RepID=A0AA88GTM2_NAELO|nr:uncharacterized protein C9374_002414 [Naegleria lovaniensis]KAG2386670.1 hypothetical protein C9374_002414 [Naegleria lovaniensis]
MFRGHSQSTMAENSHHECTLTMTTSSTIVEDSPENKRKYEVMVEWNEDEDLIIDEEVLSEIMNSQEQDSFSTPKKTKHDSQVFVNSVDTQQYSSVGGSQQTDSADSISLLSEDIDDIIIQCSQIDEEFDINNQQHDYNNNTMEVKHDDFVEDDDIVIDPEVLASLMDDNTRDIELALQRAFDHSSKLQQRIREKKFEHFKKAIFEENAVQNIAHYCAKTLPVFVNKSCCGTTKDMRTLFQQHFSIRHKITHSKFCNMTFCDYTQCSSNEEPTLFKLYPTKAKSIHSQLPLWLETNSTFKKFNNLSRLYPCHMNDRDVIYIIFVKFGDVIKYYAGRAKMGITNRFVEKDYCHVYKADMAESGFYDLYSDFIIGLVDPKYVFIVAFDTVAAAKQLHSLVLYSNDKILRDILLAKYEEFDVSTLDFFEHCCIYYLQETRHSLNQKIGIEKKYSRNQRLKRELEILDYYIRNHYESILQWISERRDYVDLHVSSHEESVEDHAKNSQSHLSTSHVTSSHENNLISHMLDSPLFKSVLLTLFLILLVGVFVLLLNRLFV